MAHGEHATCVSREFHHINAMYSLTADLTDLLNMAVTS